MDNRIEDVTNRVSENFNELRDELDGRTKELRDNLHSFVDSNPLLAVGVAFGVGYLLSGALVSRTTFKIASLGSRVLLGGFLKQVLAGVGPGMLFAAMAGREGATQTAEAGGQGNGNGNRT
jgi:hypothetical protein